MNKLQTLNQMKFKKLSYAAVSSHDFDELLANILQDNKGIKQKEVMRVLTEEARSEEDTRKYDIRNILLDEVEGKIVWQDFGGTKQEKIYSSKTIANRLTEVRKLI